MFDTLKLKVSDPELLNLSGMLRIETIHPDKEVSSVRWIYPKTNFGAYISKKEGEDFFSIEFSAKILRDSYLKGISLKTNDLLIKNILLNCPVLKKGFDPLECGVFRADHTINIKSKNTTNILRCLRESASWGRKLTDRRFTDSAIFFNTRESLITYDKFGEVKKFWADFKGLGIPLYSFRNLLRLEYRPKKIDILRKSVGLNSKFDELVTPKLIDIILNYKNTIKEKVNDFKFASVNDIEDYSEFLFGSGKLDTNLKILGLYTYFRSINFDEKVMENDIEKMLVKSQRSKFRSKLKDFRKDINEKKNLTVYKDEFLESIEKALNEY